MKKQRRRRSCVVCDGLGVFFFFLKSLAWAVRPALCFLFLSRNLFLYFLYSNSLWTEISFSAKYSKKMGPCKPLKPATVLRIVRFDRGSSGFLHFSHRAVLRGKRTAKMSGLRFSRSDRTVRSGFQNPAYTFVRCLFDSLLFIQFLRGKIVRKSRDPNAKSSRRKLNHI